VTRHELRQLVAIWRDLKRGGQTGEPMDRLEALTVNAAIDAVLEDEVNDALEQSAKGTGDDHKQRSI
jgi:hypothetical protein